MSGAIAEANSASKQIGRACNLCRLSHTACDSTRPCRRCVAIGKAHLCADVEMRKRGRPRKTDGSKAKRSKGKKSSGRSPEAIDIDTEDSGSSSASKKPRTAISEEFRITMPAGFSSSTSLSQATERISNISSSYFGMSGDASSQTSFPPFSYSVGVTAPTSSSSTAPTLQRGSSASQAPFGSDSLTSSSPSSSSSSPFSSPPSSPSSRNSLLESIASSLLRSRDDPAGGGKRDDMLEGILSLVLEELREVKQNNRDMQKQLKKLAKRQDQTESQMAQLKSPSAYSSPASTQTSIPPIQQKVPTEKGPATALTSSALSDILNRMPFLMDYPVSTSNFVVNDARKPFYAIRVISQYIGEDSSPPIFIFVNNAYAELSGYALNELLGRNVNKVTIVDEQSKKEMLSKLFQSAPQTISDPFPLPVMMRRKDGRVLRCDCRHQAFYNELGYIRWCVTVIDSHTELDIRSEDLPLDWTPPIAWGQPASRPATLLSSLTSSSPALSSSSLSQLNDKGFASSSRTPQVFFPDSSTAEQIGNRAQAPYPLRPQHQQLPGNAASVPSMPPSSIPFVFPPPPASNPGGPVASGGLQPPTSTTASVPSPFYSGTDDRIDLQELLSQLIPPSPSMPSYGSVSTPISLSSSSSGLPTATPTVQTSIHMTVDTRSVSDEYPWLQAKEQREGLPGQQQQQEQTPGTTWYVRQP